MSTWYLPTSIPTNSFSDSTMAPFPPRDPPAFPTLRIRASSPSNCSGGTGGIDPATWLSLERTFVALGRNGRPGRPSAPFPTSSSRYKVEGRRPEGEGTRRRDRKQTPQGGRGPLSLTLSPLRGARANGCLDPYAKIDRRPSLLHLVSLFVGIRQRPPKVRRPRPLTERHCAYPGPTGQPPLPLVSESPSLRLEGPQSGAERSNHRFYVKAV